MGRRRIIKLPSPDLVVVTLGGVNSCLARLSGRACVFSFDKAREGTAGNWICSPERIQQELGFAPKASLEDRLQETVDWYRTNNWF
jgi:nucleoside-diphosphate-sugar epimerase